MGVILEPHNLKTYKQTKRLFEKGNRVAVVHPTGTGKSYIALKLIEDNEGKRIIYLAPSRTILYKIKEDMIKSGIRFSDGKDKLVKRYTYQKLTKLLKDNKLKLSADIIILDEFHHCGAPEWGKAVEELLKQNPNAKVLGLSATPMRYFDESVRDMAEELFEQNIASEMTFAEAIKQGILPEPIYTTGIYDVSKIKKEYEEKIEKYPEGEEKELAKSLLKKLVKSINSSIQGLPELLEKTMKNKSGKYVVYCRNIEDMQEKMQQAKELFGRVNSEIEIYSISSRKYDSEGNAVLITDVQNRRQINSFEKATNNGKLKLLFSVDMVNEGYHYKGLDGVIMMRPTSSPTVFSQQLGRAFSVGGDKKPIVIDLVNNTDSIRIIEGFYKRIKNIRGNNKKSVLNGISVSEEMHNVSELIEKLDTLLKRKNNLSYQEKLDLMVEYIESIEGTDESFTSDTIYKGFNIGQMRNLLRASYWNGTLKMDEEILKEFKKYGIIIEKPSRIRTSIQEKYEFLVSNIGKSKEELKQAKMESGLTYNVARSAIQHLYNIGQLDLTLEQIDYLKKNGILNLSIDERNQLEKKYGIPFKYVKKIITEYGSIKTFLEKYKRCECDFNFGKDVFVGARSVVVSERDMTVKQKLGYYKLCDFYSDESDSYLYIDVDKLEEALNELNEEEQKILRARYLSDNNKTNLLKSIGENVLNRTISRRS